MRYVVIMAGGSGTRLWPLSRRGTPKQLLPLAEGASLLQRAYERAVRLVPHERVFVVTGASYSHVVRAQLEDLPPDNVLGEPMGRDSLNAVAWPAAILAARDPDAVVAQLTADQLIDPVDTFVEALELAYTAAETHSSIIVTLGVVPSEPHTGYGYLHRGSAWSGHQDVFEVIEFTEKPAADVAAQYVDSGEYWWNAGMFVFRADTLLDQVAELEPATHATVRELAAHPDRLGDLFGSLKKISLDYAIMEPLSRGQGSARIVAVPLPVAWRDVGGYPSLMAALEPDDAGNVLSGPGKTVVQDTADTLMLNLTEGHLVAVLGVEGLVVVHTADATLVTTRDRAEHVKTLVDTVADTVGLDYI